MKKGYSILLGEYINAPEADYEDCADFQIVCPECDEPIFKCERHIENKDDIHYFSHYGAKLPEQKGCELRIQQYESSEVVAHNAKSRKQRLEHFLALLPHTLGSYDLYPDDGTASHTKMKKSRAISLLYQEVKRIVKVNQQESFIDMTIQDVKRRLKQQSHHLNTTFAEHIQIRIMKDMWRSIRTVPQEPNLLFLFRHAFLAEMSSWFVSAHHYQPGTDDHTQSLILLKGFQNAFDCRRDNHAKKLIRNFMNQPLLNSDGTVSSLYQRMIGNIMVQMAEALLVMPYSEILSNKFGVKNLDYPKGVISDDPQTEAETQRFFKQQQEDYSKRHPSNSKRH